mmetsp:Transcript_11172/g.26624  ORF Transcript_11172/g.26624 Transcript_11172/m.26624 type:complete len:203 (+) Transcript_11172:191-799(+)
MYWRKSHQPLTRTPFLRYPRITNRNRTTRAASITLTRCWLLLGSGRRWERSASLNLVAIALQLLIKLSKSTAWRSTGPGVAADDRASTVAPRTGECGPANAAASESVDCTSCAKQPGTPVHSLSSGAGWPPPTDISGFAVMLNEDGIGGSPYDPRDWARRGTERLQWRAPAGSATRAAVKAAWSTASASRSFEAALGLGVSN